MNDEVANTGILIRKYIERIVVSVLAMFTLLWTIYIGYNFATKPRRDGKYNRYALSIGAATIVLGIIFVTTGLAIVADSALDLTGRLQRGKIIDTQQDGAARYRKRIFKDIARFIATVISMLLLTWAVYAGIRLAAAPRQDGQFDHLAFSVGVVTIAFGTIYLTIGLFLVADLAVNLSSVLKRHEDTKKKQQEEDIHNSCHDNIYNNNSINN